VGADVLQGLQDGNWDWGRSGQEGSLGLEAVLISYVLDLDELSLGRVVRVASVDLVSSKSGLLGGDSVAGLVGVVVVTIGPNISTTLGDVGTSILAVGGSGVGAGQESGGNEHLFTKITFYNNNFKMKSI